MYYVGIDVHQKSSSVEILDCNGKLFKRQEVKGRWRVRDSLCGHCFRPTPQPVVFGLFVLTEPFASQRHDRLRPRHIPKLLGALHAFAKEFDAGFGDA